MQKRYFLFFPSFPGHVCPNKMGVTAIVDVHHSVEIAISPRNGQRVGRPWKTGKGGDLTGWKIRSSEDLRGPHRIARVCSKMSDGVSDCCCLLSRRSLKLHFSSFSQMFCVQSCTFFFSRGLAFSNFQNKDGHLNELQKSTCKKFAG